MAVLSYGVGGPDLSGEKVGSVLLVSTPLKLEYNDFFVNFILYCIIL